MSILLLIPIKLFHVATVAFIVCVPFTNTTDLLKIHTIALPVIILHWILNNNTCCLTLMEHSIRNSIYGNHVAYQQTFIEPIYDFKMNNEDMSSLIYNATIALWLISIYKLYQNL